MGWVELHITTTAPHVDLLGEQLTELGALALTLKDAGTNPVYEPRPGETPRWQDTLLISLFTDDTDLNPALTYLETQQKAGLLSTFVTVPIQDQAWERVCLQDFKAMRFGSRLWVCPSQETPPQDKEAVVVKLDPGLAFGTGTSPTTALCLEWLDGATLQTKTVLDYGCGSGILAIAALKLGASTATAIDYDPQAILATQDNALRNGISSAELHVGTLTDIGPIEVDVVIANILASTLIELVETIVPSVKIGGHLVLSGLLNEQVDAVLACYAPYLTFEPVVSKEGWARLSGIRIK